MPVSLPEHLLCELSKGNVVAFVGAGFSSAANFPTWGALIQGIANDQRELPSKEKDTICTLAGSKNFHDLDMAAQLLSDTISQETFNEAIRARLTVTDKSELPQEMKDRIESLMGIPFAAIITTNYDNLLSGVDAQDTASFQRATFSIMRAKVDEYSRLEALAFSKYRRSLAPIIKLHGDVERPTSKFVCTREGYRNLLHGSSQYSTFLKTLLATHTMLYIGFSFSDAYINELRQEVMALYGSNGANAANPMGYAVMCGISDVQQTALLRHDGLRVINYELSDLNGHSEFTRILNNLYLASNPTVKFGRLLHNRNVLWVHTNWSSSRDSKYLKEYLEDANKTAMGGEKTCRMIVVASAEEAIQVLSESHIDCIVSIYDCSADYGHSGGDEKLIGTETNKLLMGMPRDWSHVSGTACASAPVLVFGYDTECVARRSNVMRRGARCYTYKYFELLSEMGNVLKSVRSSPRR
jgi:NAD-dependent SIR2 family protein deacetylase